MHLEFDYVNKVVKKPCNWSHSCVRQRWLVLWTVHIQIHTTKLFILLFIQQCAYRTKMLFHLVQRHDTHLPSDQVSK